jgi:hypothetical protein
MAAYPAVVSKPDDSARTGTVTLSAASNTVWMTKNVKRCAQRGWTLTIRPS